MKKADFETFVNKSLGWFNALSVPAVVVFGSDKSLYVLNRAMKDFYSGSIDELDSFCRNAEKGPRFSILSGEAVISEFSSLSTDGIDVEFSPLVFLCRVQGYEMPVKHSCHTADTLEKLNALAHEAAAEGYVLSLCYLIINNYNELDAESAISAEESVAALLASAVRNSDIIKQLSHNEFLLIFSKCHYDIAETIMTTISGKIDTHNSLSGARLEVSYGIKEYGSQCADASELIEAAKKASRQGK